MNKKVVGVIPARYGSTRFPGKPLALIKGKPMIQWTIEGVKKSKKLTEVIVATDDLRIHEFVQSLGYHSVMTSTDLTSGTDRVFEAIKNLNFDAVVNIQGDEPLIKAELIDTLIDELFSQNPPYAMASLCQTLEVDDLKNPDIVKVILNQNDEAIYFSRWPIPHSRVNDPLVSFRHMGIYAYQKDFLEKFCKTPPTALERSESLEQLRALYLGERIRMRVVSGRSLGVDRPEDVQKIERFLS